MGTKGTCKTSLVVGLAKHLALCVSGDDEAQVISFNVDKFGVEVSVCVCVWETGRTVEQNGNGVGNWSMRMGHDGCSVM